MLALEVDYLMGRAVASSRDDRRVVEWPPHPARLFAALVAGFEECELGDEVRSALEWLEALPEPSIYADPPVHEGLGRDVHSVFVPVNDGNEQQSPQKKKYSAISPDMNFRRNRQERYFPAFTPRDSTVYFVWKDVNHDDARLKALQQAAQNVTYLGHSMSPVRVAVRNEAPEPNLIPHPGEKLRLRTTGLGRLRYLETLHMQRMDNTLIQPHIGRVGEYRVKGGLVEPELRSLYQRIYILRKKQGCRLPIEAAFGACCLVRKAVMELCDDPLPETISGHMPDGTATGRPHLTVMPLPNVGHRYADGHIMGFAVLMPETAGHTVLDQLENGLEKLTSLNFGLLGQSAMELLDAETLATAPNSLQPATFTRKHRVWASVTPVVFGHFPKRKPGKDALAVIGKSCSDIGLPAPADVQIVPTSVFNGVPPAKLFTCNRDYERTDYLRGKMAAHIVVSFDTPVQGPVVLGAGRFLGLGACRPYRVGEGHSHAGS
ncbi:MAG: type I-G CRISPR-associated protein Csb2 [Gammaproteobacteria bacterium]